MNRDIEALPLWAKLVALAILASGWLAGTIFLSWYGTTRPWWRSEMGAHVFTFTACVWAFFTLYLGISLWPDMPSWIRISVRLSLLAVIVGAMWWRLSVFARGAWRDARAAATERSDRVSD